jgi:hypothetical protein
MTERRRVRFAVIRNTSQSDIQDTTTPPSILGNYRTVDYDIFDGIDHLGNPLGLGE